jgi:hypothetical protein
MPKQITQTIYSFDELKDDIQDKVINDFINKGIFDIDYQDLKYTAIEYLKENNLPNETINYSLNYSQGDGIRFLGTFNKEQKLKLFELVTNNEELKQSLIDNIDILDIEITKCDLHYRYTHNKTMSIDINYNPDIDIIDNNLVELENLFNKHIRNKSIELEQLLYNEIEAYQTKEYITDCILANEYMFLDNGKLY